MALGTVIIQWRLIVGLIGVMAILCGITCWFLHESPEWLLKKGLGDDAERAWKFYNPDSPLEDYKAFAAAVEKQTV